MKVIEIGFGYAAGTAVCTELPISTDLSSRSLQVVSKVENADYDGSALEMLFRVCVALKKRFTVCGPGVTFKTQGCGVAVTP